MHINLPSLINRAILLTSMAFSTLLVSCESHEESHKEATYVVTQPIVKDTITKKEYVCQIRAYQHIEVRALESAYLEKVFVDEGQFVKKGQLMFKLLPIQYNAELNRALAEANYAQIEYDNAKILSDSNVISPTQLSLIEAKYQKAMAEVALAKTRMQFTEIRAPFDGLINRFNKRVGSLLEDGEMLTTLSDVNKLWVYFNVPEAEYLEYKKTLLKDGQLEVALKMANNEIYEYSGKVETIEADFNNKTGNIAFRATFQNPDQLLRHGQTGNVVLDIPHQNAMVIPQKATFEELDQKFVYIVDKDNRLKTTRIHVEEELPDLYIIDEGLHEGDKILLEGLRKVRDNDKIAYTLSEPKIAIASLKIPAE